MELPVSALWTSLVRAHIGFAYSGRFEVGPLSKSSATDRLCPLDDKLISAYTCVGIIAESSFQADQLRRYERIFEARDPDASCQDKQSD